MAARNDLSAPAVQPAARDAAGFGRPGAPASSPDAPAADTATQSAAPAAAAAPVPEAPAKPRSRKRRVILAILAILAVVGGYQGYGWWTTGRFMVSTDDAYVGADITILAAKASGYIAAIEVAPNQSVEAGQVIARIDDVDYKLMVQAAADKLATQRSTVGRIGRQVEAARAQIPQAEAQLGAARADGVRSAADYDRQTRLAQSDFASKSKLEQSLADRDRAVANVKGAEAGILAAQANVAVLEAQRAEADKVAAEYRTALAKAERDLEFTVIRAPVAGVVGNRAVEVGSYVQPGTRLAALVPLATLHVDANFKETQIGRILPGQKVEIEVDALSGRTVPGIVESIAPASGAQFSLLPPENATGNFTKIVQRVPVRVKVDPAIAESVLRPGLSVVVRIDSRDKPEPAATRAAAR